jgi:hypothetical protein
MNPMRFKTKVTILAPPDITHAQLNKNPIGSYSLFVIGQWLKRHKVRFNISAIIKLE